MLNFLALLRKIKNDNRAVSTLLKMAIAYVWELDYHLNGSGPIPAPFLPFKTLVNLWLAMLHTEYQCFNTHWAHEEGRRYHPDLCDCVLCQPDQRDPFSGDAFWRLMRATGVPCDCPECQVRQRMANANPPVYGGNQDQGIPSEPQPGPSRQPAVPMVEDPPAEHQSGPSCQPAVPGAVPMVQSPPTTPPGPSRRSTVRSYRSIPYPVPSRVPSYSIIVQPNGLRAVFRRERGPPRSPQ